MGKQTLHAIPAGTPIKSSGFLRLNLRDLSRGTVMAALGSIVSSIAIEAAKFTQEGVVPNINTLKTALAVGIVTGCTYLLKNLFEDAKVIATDKSVIKLGS